MDRKSIPRISLCLAAAVIAGGLASPARADEAPLRKVTIDATVTVGALRPLNGVQAAGAEGAAFYKTARVDLVRIHDVSGAGDVDAIFPDMSADAENPKSYQFAADRSAGRLDQIGRRGAAVPDRQELGRRANRPRTLINGHRSRGTSCFTITQGWDRGFRYGIRYWEIWNAPDSKLSWSGSPEEYYSLVRKDGARH